MNEGFAIRSSFGHDWKRPKHPRGLGVSALEYLVPCWGHINHDHLLSLLGLYSNKHVIVSNKDPGMFRVF